MTSAHRVQRVINLIFEGNTVKKALEIEQLSVGSFYKYLHDDHNALSQYMLARASSAHLLAEQVIDIADNDFDPMRARNRIDARRWLASKLNPKTYGEKLDLTVDNRIDIRGALDEARARVSLPMRDLTTIAQVEVSERTDKQLMQSTGSEPDDTQRIDPDELLS